MTPSQIPAYLRLCLTILDYHRGYRLTGDARYAWGLSDCLTELELMRGGEAAAKISERLRRIA